LFRVSLVRVHSSDPDEATSEAERKPHWLMIVSLGEPEKMKGEWSIQYQAGEDKDPSKFFKEYFDYSLRLVAKHVCDLVKGVGGNIGN
jgi:hypothetical protein